MQKHYTNFLIKLKFQANSKSSSNNILKLFCVVNVSPRVFAIISSSLTRKTNKNPLKSDQHWTHFSTQFSCTLKCKLTINVKTSKKKTLKKIVENQVLSLQQTKRCNQKNKNVLSNKDITEFKQWRSHRV